MSCVSRCVNSILPPHILNKLVESEDRLIREAALSTLLTTAQLRGERLARATAGFSFAAPARGRRTIYNCRHLTFLPLAILARTEDGRKSSDESVNRAFDALGTTREFYKQVLDRDSIDGRGMRLDGYAHYGVRYGNAFWDGREMVFGDGDGRITTDFTRSLDVVAHELTHGVTENTAGLEYHLQPGALNESISDVFGSLVKQWSLGQTADEADWLIGADVFTPSIEADALRSMKAPGTAYDNTMIGKDPQPDHMEHFVEMPDTERGDWGGVHINSGIPNKAFYLAAAAIGGHAWEAPGQIWYQSLLASHPSTGFQEFADITFIQAGVLYGAGSCQQQAVVEAWDGVGIRVSGQPAVAPSRAAGKFRSGDGDRLEESDKNGEAIASLTRRIDTMAETHRKLTREIKALQEAR
jgi:Zn-dependent metalloprotease